MRCAPRLNFPRIIPTTIELLVSNGTQSGFTLLRPAHASVVLGSAVIVVAWAIAGATGLLYLLAFLGASLVGLPWGLALFGSRHAAGWVAGLLFGYVGAGLLWWTVALAADASVGWAVAAWTALTVVSWWLGRRVRREGPLTPLPSWTRQSTIALLVVLLLVPVLVGRPFSQIGHRAPDGSRLYRAYFTADFVWHMAVVEELAKRSSPPVDPYLSPDPLHYYWTYFLVPTALSAVTRVDTERTLALNALACGLLFVAAIYLGTWIVLPHRPWSVALAVSLVMLCGSIEGLAALFYFWWHGLPAEMVRGLNIDALSAWAFHGLRIDNLPRALWYTPQHAMAFALGMMGCLGLRTGAPVRRLGVLLAGAALGAAVAFNPFVGAVFAAVYGLTTVWDAMQRGAPRAITPRLPAAIPIAAALGWCLANQMMAGSAGRIHIGWWGPATHAPLTTLALSFLPAALPALAALASRRAAWPSTATPAIVGLGVSFVLMFTVALVVDPHWVGFRTGHLVFGWLPPIVAIGLVTLHAAGGRRAMAGIALAVLVAGLPTTLIDSYNAQDVRNDSMGPGFHWTLTLTPEQQAALRWIRQQTAEDAIVQADPISRGREWWSLVPSFAGRRMAAGLPISLMHEPEFDVRSREVQLIFSGANAEVAARRARRLQIDYLYVDASDRRRYPDTAKFDRRPDLFVPAFRDGEVAVYAVH
jgi:hypothetical protein